LCDLKADGLDSLVDALSDLEVNVQSGREKVRVYVEKKFPLVDALSDLEVNVQSGREKVRVYVEKKFP
jgi:hypothetical protein